MLTDLIPPSACIDALGVFICLACGAIIADVARRVWRCRR